jgi:hypothetical protein
MLPIHPEVLARMAQDLARERTSNTKPKKR